MSDEEIPPEQKELVKRSPLSEREMETKLDEIRAQVGRKMDKWANRLVVSMSPNPQIKRVEGERWKEGNKEWIMKDGIKQSVSLLESARMPWWCPKCSISMSHRFDRRFYYLRGWCYNCNIEWEGKMRLDGTWPAFEKRAVRENEKSYLREKIKEHQEYMRTFKVPTAHFEDGRYEELAPLSQFKGLFEELEKDIELCLDRLEQIAREEQEEVNGVVEK
jgi:hypothetical protein